MKRNKKQYLIYYLKENVLILDVFEYLESLASDIVDYLFEWHLIKENKVKFQKKLIYSFLIQKIEDDILIFNQIAKDIDCSILCFYKINNSFKEWEGFYEDPRKVISVCKSILKNKLPNFFENKNEDIRLFENIKGTFKSVPCLIPTGEDEHFLQNFLKKLKIVS